MTRKVINKSHLSQIKMNPFNRVFVSRLPKSRNNLRQRYLLGNWTQTKSFHHMIFKTIYITKKYSLYVSYRQEIISKAEDHKRIEAPFKDQQNH